MRKIIWGIIGLLFIAGVVFFVTDKKEEQPLVQATSNTEAENWKNDAENTVAVFLENAVKYGGDTNVALSKLTASAQSKIKNDEANGWVYFLGAQEVPDKGTSIISSQRINDTTVKVVTNWFYSGMSEATIRTFILVYVNNEWKIDRVEKTDLSWNWKTYTNTSSGFSIKYPSNLNVDSSRISANEVVFNDGNPERRNSRSGL